MGYFANTYYISISQQGDIMKQTTAFIVAMTICAMSFLVPACVSAETLMVESRSDQAEGSAQDVEVTRRIRKALVADKALSTNAKNIKIITLNGKVTLQGPVGNAREQKSVLKKARKTAGVKSVTSELEVTRP